MQALGRYRSDQVADSVETTSAECRFACAFAEKSGPMKLRDRLAVYGS